MFAFLCLLTVLAWPSASRAEDDFLPPEKAFPASAAMADPNTVRVEFKVPKGYYMYRERFGFTLDPQGGATLGQARLPAGDVKYDPTFDKNMEVYHQPLSIDIPVHPAGGQPGDVTLVVVGQGCAEAGICYPPMENRIKLRPINGGYQVAGPPVWGYSSGFPGGDSAGAAGAGQLAEAAPGVSVAPDTARPGLARPSGLAQAPQIDTPPGAAGKGPALAGSGATDAGFSALAGSDDIGLASAIAGMGWLKTAGAFLLLGLLLSLTPCVLPMIPILSTIVIGRSATPPSRWTGLGLAAAYVLGMSVVYTVLGVAAGLSGAGLAAWLQTPWVLTLFALLLALLALPMFDVYTFQMPASVQARMSDRASRIPGGRATGAVLMGAISALIVGPCVAAPLAGALLYISQTGDVVLGGSALFALAWGMGVPLLIVGASAGTLLPKAGAWMDGVKRFFGVLLLATAWWMVVPIVPVAVQMVGWAFLAIVGAVMLRAFEAIGPNAGAGRMFGKGLGLLLALVAVAQLVGAASGARDVLQPLAHLAARGAGTGAGAGLAANGAPGGAAGASEPVFERIRTLAELERRVAATNRPVMLDFYADWCVSCREMEKFTFTDPAVAARMNGMLLLRADVTANNTDDRALLKRFKLFGPPGIMFFDAQGRELPQARVIGFQDATRFGRSLDAVAAR
ncbi:protein-disulfide reductase DsbD [Bordetella sp. LUAb4]|uniref:protein-disulfide reductase DsbD n=1 Tax=Bordetella sp. LUAb4 TaxID=2843195 RepID=UPI001E491602|nr:protein-disulfide reductase DsbD [Bordetella sp. LUAb4]